MVTEQEFDKRLMTLRMIWFAVLMSLAIYLFVGIKAGADVQSSMNEDIFGILRTVLYAVAFATLIATRYVRKLILSGKSQGSQPTQVLKASAFQRYSAAGGVPAPL